jgi:hypothetical protein
MKTEYHEKETIVLKAPQPLDRTTLDKWLRKRGFRSEDEFYYLPRKGRCEPWQTSTIVSLDVRRAGSSVYETEEDMAEGLATNWDELRADYLLATLPRDYIASMVFEIDALVMQFGLKVEYQGETMAATELEMHLNAVADQLSKEWDAPGSETLAILIEQQYGNK